MDKEQLKEEIKSIVVQSVMKYVRNNDPSKEKNFQILNLLIPKERLIRSIVGGIETSMGRTLWEPLAKKLAKDNGFELMTTKLQAPAHLPQNLGNIISSLTEDRFKLKGIHTAQSTKLEIKKVCQIFIDEPIGKLVAPPKGNGVDIWLKKDNINYLFDTKTVQPNISKLKNMLNQLIHWYAYFYAQKPKETVECRIIFPYNPYSKDFWVKTKGKGHPLCAHDEAWVENEFWDFISGHDQTFAIIKESFSEIYRAGTLEKELNTIFNRQKDDIATAQYNATVVNNDIATAPDDI